MGIGNRFQPSLLASASGIPIILSNIPQNNNKRGKIKTNQPTLPKEKKKIPKQFRFGVSGNVGKAQLRWMRKNQGGFCLSVTARFLNYQRFQSLFQTESNKKVGSSRSTSHLPAKFWGGSQSLRKKKTKPYSTGVGNLHLFLGSGGGGGIVGFLGISGCAACLPGWRRGRAKEQP